MIEQLFNDYCEAHHLSKSSTMLEAVSDYFSKPGRLRPNVLTKDIRKQVMTEYLNSKETLTLNLFHPCGRR